MNKTDIANRALRNLGATWTISDFDNDNQNHAKVIRNAFQQALDTITESSDWSFATKSRDLIYTGEGTIGWGFKYTLPADCLVLRQIGTEELITRLNVPKQFLPAWEFNDGVSSIQCDIEDAWGKYTRRIMQDEQVPNYFGIAVAGKLALDVGPALIGDRFTAIMNALTKTLTADMDRAIAYDSGRQPNNEQQVSTYELLLQ